MRTSLLGGLMKLTLFTQGPSAVKKVLRSKHADCVKSALAGIGNGYQDTWLISASGHSRVVKAKNPSELFSALPEDAVTLEKDGLGAVVTTRGGDVWQVKPITHKKYKKLTASR